VTPLPAIFALRDSWVHICSSDSSDVVPHVEAFIDEKFCIVAALYIPNVDPYYGHI